MPNKCLRSLFIALVSAHLLIGGFYIFRWFRESMILSFLHYYHIPREDRIFTTGLNEYYAILQIIHNLPEDVNFLWVPQVSPIINYYVYPRKIYQKKIYQPGEKVEVDKQFLESRHIGFVFMDYGKLYPLYEKPQSVQGD